MADEYKETRGYEILSDEELKRDLKIIMNDEDFARSLERACDDFNNGRGRVYREGERPSSSK